MSDQDAIDVNGSPLPPPIPDVFVCMRENEAGFLRSMGGDAFVIPAFRSPADYVERVVNKNVTIILPGHDYPSTEETDAALADAACKIIAAFESSAVTVGVQQGYWNNPREAADPFGVTPGHAFVEQHGPERRACLAAEAAPGALSAAEQMAERNSGSANLPIIDPTSWEGAPVPARCWHVVDLIPGRTVTKLSGNGGEGKSLLALQLLASTALGMCWLGRDVPQGRALYLSAEDDADEVQRRLADIVREYGVSFRDLKDLRISPLAGLDAVLAAPATRGAQIIATPLWRALEAMVETFKPSILAIDTLADAFAGDEINRSQARQFIGLLRGLAIKHDMVVLLLAHPSLTGMASGRGSSGSTGWDNSVRSALYLTPAEALEGETPDPDLRVLKTVKSNYARTGTQIAMRWRQGVFVAEGDEQPASWLDRKAATSLAETVFLSLLANYTARGTYVSEKPCCSYAPAIFAKDEAAKGVRKNALHNAMNRLFAAGKIVNVTVGTGTRARQVLAIAEGEAPC